MDRKTTLIKSVSFLSLIGSCFLPLITIAQVTIINQGFDSLPADTWNYTSTLNTGEIATNTTRFVSSPNSLRLVGSNSIGTGSLNNDPSILFNNQSLTGYTDAKLNIAFSSDGSPDDDDNLYLDISYDNGSTFATSIKLIDGKNSASSDDLAFTHAPSAGNTTGSIYTYNIPNGNSQVRVRVRFDELDNQTNTSDYYFIDNITLTATPVGFFINFYGLNSLISYNSTPTTINGTDFGNVVISSSPIIRTFTIKNNGTGTINLTGSPLISISGSSDFTIVAMPANSISSLNSTTFKIKFNPSSVGAKTATLSVPSNDSDENPYIIELKGTGIQTIFDSDGDSVLDSEDIDSDNDGILNNVECSNFVKPRFLNTDFEDINIMSSLDGGPTDVVPTVGIWKGQASNIPNWESADIVNNHLEIWHNSQMASNDTGGQAFSGLQWAEINATTNDGLYQDITTTPGDVLQWSFAHRKRTGYAGSATEDIARLLIGNPSGTLTSQGNFTSAGDASWTEHKGIYVVPAGQTTTRLTFTAISAVSGSTSSGNFVDKIQLYVIPNCEDTDGDGVPNYLDLDSDNDGIPDLVETGLGHLNEGKATLTYISNFIDANSNGLLDAVENHIDLDTDGDGIPNYLDLDSDNDSLFDVDESGAGNSGNSSHQNGDGDINGDGVGDGADTEFFRVKDSNADGILETYGDGILDIYDYFSGSTYSASYGNTNQGSTGLGWSNYVKDTDNDGIPDYLDLTSNGSTFDIATSLQANLDTDNDGRIDGNTDLDKDGILDLFDTNNTAFGSPRNLERKLYTEFDGRNDYGQDASVINSWPNATLMSWINLNSAYASEGIIVGQDKFHLKIDASKRLQAVANGTTITYPTPLATAQWTHVAAIYDSSNSLLKLYLNGAMVNSTAISGSLSADTSPLTIGKNPSASNKFFKGKIDEIRLFDLALTDSQLQKIVYQEIQNNSGQTRGAIVPKDVTAVPWTNLKRYFRMDNFKDNVIDDHTTAAIDISTGARIYNVKNINYQQAPMPFATERTGDIATALNSLSNEVRGQDATDCNWAIMIVNHDINSEINHTNLGMIISPSKNVTIGNDTKLQNDWYLKLDGKIDLQGRSQLVQTEDSDLDPLSSGSIERDQQGTNNIYNYNYWSAPVGPINAVTNNNNYTVGGVFKDGTNPANPTNINWIGGYNGASGTPIHLARYWIYKFQNLSNAYANWTQVLETGSLAPAQGFTLKGSGTGSPEQNYTFIGKPFNSTISNPIAANNLNLSGNPYASAIDANAFITDNVSSTNGTLYFWEHYATNNSHNLAAYKGGYATRNLTGGTVPVAPALISGLGSSTRIPGRFIPVGQGFFIKGNVIGGNIVFKNSQRIFVKEDDMNSNVMFRKATTTSELTNSNDPYEEDIFSKIRLGYTTQDNLHRQVLLGFMNEKATSGLDYGYDALLFDEFINDMYFLHGTNKLIIQGDGFFNANSIYPIAIKSAVTGNVKFMIDGSENFNSGQPLYIHDNQTNTYHDIRNEIFEVDVPIGENTTRFSLRFNQGTLNTSDNTVNGIQISHVQNGNILVINNELLDITVQKVALFNIIGQSVKNWDVENKNQQNIQIPIHNLSAGTYIAKIKTTKGDISKKLIIK